MSDTPQRQRKTQYDFGKAITRPWNLSGGRNYLFRLLLWSAALFLIIWAFFGQKFISGYVDFIKVVSEFENSSSPDPQQITGLMSAMLGFFGGMFLLAIMSWMLMISTEAAYHKHVFRGYDGGFFPLRFGKDEFRLLLVYLVFVILITLAFFAVYLLFIMVMLLFIGIAAGTGSEAVIILVSVVGVLLLLVMMVGMTLFSFRFAPAGAMTIRDRKFRFFEAWTATKGYMGILFGSYALVYIIGYILIYMIMIATIFIVFGNSELISLIFGDIPSDPEALFAQLAEMLKSPSVIIPLIIGSIIYVLVYMLWYMHFWGIGNYMAELDVKNTAIDDGTSL